MSLTSTPSTRGPWRRAALGAVAAAALVATAPALSSAAGFTTQDGLETRCTGVAGPVTVPTNLVVPAGQTCFLQGTVVQGDVDVRAGANLVAESGATIEGDVLVRRDAYVEVIDGSVAGQTNLRQAFGGYAEGSDLAVVDVRNSGFFYTLDVTQADYTAVNSETSLESSWVAGDITTRGGLLTDVHDTVVEGRLTVREAELGSLLCASEFDDRVVVRDSGGVVQVGDGIYAGCDGNVFASSLTLQGNVTDEGTHVSDNVIRGNLACSDNDPAPVGEGNRVRGQATGQCADLQPAMTGSRFAPQGADRTADTERQLEQRSAQAREAAEKIGPAGIGR